MQDAVTVQQPQDMQRPRIKIKTVFEVVKRYQKTDPDLLLGFPESATTSTKLPEP
jgi:hypothetical protein